MSNCCDSKHPDHSAQLAKLNRISGQLEGVKKMIHDQRYCVDIMTQLKAVQAATKSVEASILKLHLESCIQNTFNSTNEEDKETKIEELLSLFKKN